ncbi:hypothetical protein WOLCODRAFT_26237 [Wolfiporia cocos MD-104 SS10]|uniref:Mid2 domain-containing protein n=1 Tax=Wolfiporia cocos (strain MD-104) TaxID=742152 RepID=A0A2H3JY73_WOLCO|nr:hypothetical protein WOLCODRAFT_26237 [Wolfiporia cocos MD-104 SS10]
MLGSSKLVVCLLSLYFSSLVAGAPVAAPAPLENALNVVAREPQALAAPTTVQTSNIVQTTSGTMIETCDVVLTPDGNGSVQEVKSCTLTPIGSSSPDSTSVATATAAATAAAGTAPAIVVVGESSIASTAVFTSPATASATVSGAAASAATSAAVSAGGAIATGTAADSTPTPVNNDANGGSAANASGAVASSSASAATVSTTAKAAAVVTFTIPGRHILIIPVGLVIYCTLTGIVMIIVALVTIERVMYRRAFRQRRLAEQGAPMGYGGMGKV